MTGKNYSRLPEGSISGSLMPCLDINLVQAAPPRYRARGTQGRVRAGLGDAGEPSHDRG